MTLGLLGFVAVGIALGLLGGGGSILAVPVLVHLMAVPAGVAVPMSLPVVGVTAAVGAGLRWRSGQLRLPEAGLFAAVTMAGSFAAARLGAGIPDDARLGLFVVVMLLAAVMLWRRATRPGAPVEPATDRRRLVLAGVAVGSLTGLVGVGGGFLIVPALVGALGFAMPHATATSLAVIALNTLAAGLGWFGRVTLDLPLTAMVTGAALVGMALGTRLAPRVPAAALTKGFALLLLVVAVLMLVLR
jgi:uncharacterized protein